MPGKHNYSIYNTYYVIQNYDFLIFLNRKISTLKFKSLHNFLLSMNLSLHTMIKASFPFFDQQLSTRFMRNAYYVATNSQIVFTKVMVKLKEYPLFCLATCYKKIFFNFKKILDFEVNLDILTPILNIYIFNIYISLAKYVLKCILKFQCLIK
jgi:hypothetical protein